MWDIVSDGVKGCQICFPRTIPHTPSLKTGSGVYMFCVFVDKRIPTTVKCRSKFRQLIDRARPSSASSEQLILVIGCCEADLPLFAR